MAEVGEPIRIQRLPHHRIIEMRAYARFQSPIFGLY
jgi:hypothetical protein